MAKDRRQANTSKSKNVTQKQFYVRVTIAAIVLLVVGVGLITLCILWATGAFSQAPTAPQNTVPTVMTPTAAGTSTSAVTTTATAATTGTTLDTAAPVTTTTLDAASTTTTTQTMPQGHYTQDGAWNMILINPWNQWTEQELNAQTDIIWYSGSEYVDSRIIDPLNDMLSDGSAYGLWVCSGYRSYGTQEILFDREVNEVLGWMGGTREEAEVEAATVVARPGTSEHHTGLAVDLLNSYCYELEEYWDQSPAFDWMMEHCAEYGFILRYPKDKQHITGVIYEPWHYRYVGVEAATEIMSRGITLEEYLQERQGG